MKLWRWEEGRQGSGYRKLTLAFSKRFQFDCYLIEIREGVAVPTHHDPVQEGYQHYRYNLTLWSPKKGGVTYIDLNPLVPGVEYLPDGKTKVHITERSYIFRPDIYPHGVTKVEKGRLLLFSVGWLKKAPT